MSLAEVLIVIAVIGLLAAISVPFLLKSKTNSRQKKCEANLKQIGTALRLFAAENNDWLPPGPSDPNEEPRAMANLQAPVYGMNTFYKKWLPYYLAPHLGLPTPTEVGKATNIAEVFICPAYLASMPANSYSGDYNPVADNYMHAFSYAVTRPGAAMSEKYKLPSRPFGEKGVTGPLKLMDIQAVAPLAEIYALVDFDTSGVANPESLGSNSLPFSAKVPVHDTVRNLLYFDGHVAARDVATMRKY